jgi:hypothetical protein
VAGEHKPPSQSIDADLARRKDAVMFRLPTRRR